VKIVASPAIQAAEDFQERTEDQVPQADQELQDDQDDHQLSAVKSKSQLATNAHLDHPDQTDLMEHQETTADQEAQADPATQAAQAMLDYPAHLDHQETVDPTDNPETPADQPNPHQISPETQDQPENQDHLVFPEITDHQAEMDNQDHLATVAHLVHQEAQEEMATPDQKDHPDLPANQEKEESVPNIVPWMAVFSSRMEAEGSREDEESSGFRIPISTFYYIIVLYTQSTSSATY
jgi:hypothetical protein